MVSTAISRQNLKNLWDWENGAGFYKADSPYSNAVNGIKVMNSIGSKSAHLHDNSPNSQPAKVKSSHQQVSNTLVTSTTSF